MAELRRYTLTLTEGQARVLSDAAELLARLHMGQLEEAAGPLLWHREGDEAAVEPFVEVRKGLRELIPLLPGLDFPGDYFSIASPSLHDRARIAYDLHGVIRNRLAWDRHPEGGDGVQFLPPQRRSTTEMLAKMEPVEADEAALCKCSVIDPHEIADN